MENKLIKTETVLGRVLNVYGTPEDPLFVAQNVADWISHKDASSMVRILDEDEKLLRLLCGAGQNRQVLMITEEGLYEVLFQSRKPIAKAFKKEVKRILKELRVRGVTAAPATLEEMIKDPKFAIRLLTELDIEREAKKKEKLRADLNEQIVISKNHTIEELSPRAALADKILDMDENIDIGQVAKILELSYGRNILFRKLRESGIFFKKRNEPRQEHIKSGYFKLKEHIVRRKNNPDILVIKVLVTQKGLEWLARKLGVTIITKSIANLN